MTLLLRAPPGMGGASERTKSDIRRGIPQAPLRTLDSRVTLLVVRAWILGTLAALILGGLAVCLRLWLFLRWYRQQTGEDAYYGRTAAERASFRTEFAERGRFVVGLAERAARVRRPRRPPGFRWRGVAGPPPCRRGFRLAAAYHPIAGDVFVVSQMKCGTTWMQQIVYEVLSSGRGDLGDGGHRALYALSPWIESFFSVPLERAPRIGEHKARLIKTHLPTDLCPYGGQARYVYVTRHPVACFASCVDFVTMLFGPLAPCRRHLLDWYCSDHMWWRPWPDHVEGWWRWTQERSNVLFIRYEELLVDLPAVVDRVAEFLETPLGAGERRAVIEKSGFDYMKRHEERFEMAPPTPFSVLGEATFLRSGGRERERDASAAERQRILAFCRERLRGAAYPAARDYPDLG
jgi:Sulfotransferase domain